MFHAKERENLLLLCGLLGDEGGVDVGEDTASSDGDAAHELVELLVVANGELDVAWDDACLLVVACGVAGKLKHLSSEVLKDGCHVDGCASTDTCRDLCLLHVACDTANGELQACLCRAGHRLGSRRLLATTTWGDEWGDRDGIRMGREREFQE